MTTATAVWLYLIGAAILASWAMVRFPNSRPRSLVGAFALFIAGQLIPLLGLIVLPSVLQLAGGVRVALPVVVLPSFFVPWLTLGWLLWAIVDSIRAPRRAGLS